MTAVIRCDTFECRFQTFLESAAERKGLAFEEGGFMIVVNTESIPGYHVTHCLGIVQGNVVRAKHVGRDIAASLKNIVGGELRGYTELLTESRRTAMERMLAEARELQADAVVNVRFSTSAITQGAAELYVYGTAVKVEPVVQATRAS